MQQLQYLVSPECIQRR